MCKIQSAVIEHKHCLTLSQKALSIRGGGGCVYMYIFLCLSYMAGKKILAAAPEVRVPNRLKFPRESNILNPHQHCQLRLQPCSIGSHRCMNKNLEYIEAKVHLAMLGKLLGKLRVCRWFEAKDLSYEETNQVSKD